MSVYILWFMIYSFGGWLWELAFNRLVNKVWRFHGYLTLPLLPIYGFSALGILVLAQPYIHNPVALFLAAALIVSLIEYFTSLVLERVFRLKLWDYSDWPMNIKGRISIFSTLGFGFMGLVLVYVLQPMVGQLTGLLPGLAAAIIAYSLLAIFILDYINSTASITRLRLDKKKLVGPISELQYKVGTSIAKFKRSRRKLRKAFDSWYNFNIRRLRKAYPRAITLGFKKRK